MRKLFIFMAMMVATTTHAQGVIDVHTHIITPEFVSTLESEGRLLDEGFPLPKWEAEAQLQWMDEAGISTSVLTMAAPLPTSAKVIHETNEAAAKLKREHPAGSASAQPSLCPMSMPLSRKPAMRWTYSMPTASNWRQTPLDSISVRPNSTRFSHSSMSEMR